MSGTPRVGLSTTMAEAGLTGGRLDGIGVYSSALRRHLPAAGAEAGRRRALEPTWEAAARRTAAVYLDVLSHQPAH
nr:hypothetical protein [uncultured Duganella sp.]